MLGYLILSAGIGGACGVGWWLVADRPGYLVGESGGARTTELGLTQFASADAWFTLIGLVVGVPLGWLAWRLFASAGSPVVLLAVLAATLAGLACWAVGYQLGPGPFAPRLAAAGAGDLVPIELTVRARAALLVWPFGSTIPILLASSLGPDPQEPSPLFRRRVP